MPFAHAVWSNALKSWAGCISGEYVVVLHCAAELDEWGPNECHKAAVEDGSVDSKELEHVKMEMATPPKSLTEGGGDRHLGHFWFGSRTVVPSSGPLLRARRLPPGTKSSRGRAALGSPSSTSNSSASAPNICSAEPQGAPSPARPSGRTHASCRGVLPARLGHASQCRQGRAAASRGDRAGMHEEQHLEPGSDGQFRRRMPSWGRCGMTV